MTQWQRAYQTVVNLQKQGKVRIEKIPKEIWNGRQIFTTLYFLTCKNCGVENSYVNSDYLLKRMKIGFCRHCYRDNPESKFYKNIHDYVEYPRRTTISIDFPILETNGVADIYCRVSTKKQELGDGLRRQEEYGINFCKNNKIKVRNIIQDVCSAFNVDNCVSGNLGKRIKMWENGKEVPPTYLVIEDMDRFSRQNPFVAMNHVSHLKNLGIKFVISSPWNSDIIF
jgi:hypothetical protein